MNDKSTNITIDDTIRQRHSLLPSLSARQLVSKFWRACVTINYVRVAQCVSSIRSNRARKARVILQRSPLCAYAFVMFVNRAFDRSACSAFLSFFCRSHLIPFPEKSFAKVARAAAARTSALDNNRGYDCYRLRAFRPHNSCNSQHRKRGCNVQMCKRKTRTRRRKTRCYEYRVYAVPPRG